MATKSLREIDSHEVREVFENLLRSDDANRRLLALAWLANRYSLHELDEVLGAQGWHGVRDNGAAGAQVDRQAVHVPVVGGFDERSEVVLAEEGVLLDDAAATLGYFFVDFVDALGVFFYGCPPPVGEFRKHQVERHGVSPCPAQRPRCG